MTPPISNDHDARKLMHRRLFTGAVASLICAPAIVHAVNLMPVCGLIIRTTRPDPALAKRLFYHSLWCGLQSGSATALLNNRRMTESEARRMVACAEDEGWLRISPVRAVENEQYSEAEA